MFGFRSRVLESLEYIEIKTIGLQIEVARTERYLRIIMSNQEVFDAYAARIADQNSQIKAAVSALVAELANLKAGAEAPLDTANMDAAIDQLTAAVDEVEAIPAPQVTPEPVPVEQPVEVDPSAAADAGE
jgi:hypothetical protein